jgi:hypothetical protein
MYQSITKNESVFLPTTCSASEIDGMNRSKIKGLIDEAEKEGTIGSTLKFLARMVSLCILFTYYSYTDV